MWEGKERCIYPRDFRDVLCDHAQQFLGYEQHDRWATFHTWNRSDRYTI